MTTKKDRADARRVVSQQLAKERRRKQTLITTAAAAVVLLIAGFTSWGVMSAQNAATGEVTVPSVAVDEGTGFAIGTGKVKIDVYADFMCPICGQFESQVGPTLEKLATDGTVTVVYHPIAILDHYSSGTQYSTRAAGAAAAAAQGGKFLEYHKALFDRQPAEGSVGLDDATLVEIGKSVGLTDQAFADAVTKGTYRGWATQVTEISGDRGVTGTPTVLVNGKKLDNPTPDRLIAAATAG